MAVKLKKLSDQTIVITGASSGIGLATALEAAKKGARLVLASRSENSLAEAKRQVEALGGHAVTVVADVGNMEDVQRIAQTAIDKFGGFDTWINDAGVSIFGYLEEVTDEDNRRLFDTNFWGTVYGSQCAAGHLKYKGGAIINVGSVLSDMSVPLQGMYCASKHAVKGYTDALRHELESEKAKISVTLIKPSAIATPYFSHAKNYLAQDAKAPPPVYAPEAVAYAILHAAERPVRDIHVGGSGAMMSLTNAHLPRLMDWINEKFMMKAQVSDQPRSRGKDNLHEAGIDGRVEGRDMPQTMPNLYIRAALHPVATGIAVSIIGAAAYALLGKRGRVGKAAMTGLNVLLPLQNALVAKGLLKLFQKKSEMNVKSVLHNVQSAGRSAGHTVKDAVNENAKAVKQKAIAFIK